MARREIILRAGEMVLGGVFAYAGIVKAIHPAAFAREIANYQLLPWSAAAALALYLPWVEIACGAALLTRRLKGGALRVVTGLLLLFLGALLSAWFRGLEISCGCFGNAGSSVAEALLLDLLLLAVALGVMGGGARRPAVLPDCHPRKSR